MKAFVFNFIYLLLIGLIGCSFTSKELLLRETPASEKDSLKASFRVSVSSNWTQIGEGDGASISLVNKNLDMLLGICNLTDKDKYVGTINNAVKEASNNPEDKIIKTEDNLLVVIKQNGSIYGYFMPDRPQLKTFVYIQGQLGPGSKMNQTLIADIEKLVRSLRVEP